MKMILALFALAGCSKEFDDYQRKSKASEAQVVLRMLDKRLKEYSLQQGKLPVGSAPLTPAEGCCSQPGQRCAPDPALWQAEPWRTLEFEVYDASRFQYRFESDGTRYTAEAVGDLDCNGKPYTFKMTGELVDGVVKTTMHDPLRGTTTPL
jgi:type II secretory pathway pseudopilin PulG